MNLDEDAFWQAWEQANAEHPEDFVLEDAHLWDAAANEALRD